jgi:hypothetical protein
MNRRIRIDGARPAPTGYRVRGLSVRALVMLVILVAYFTYLMVAVALAGKPWAIVLFIVLGAPFALHVVLTARAGAYVTEEGVHVRNIRRAVFVPWEEIDRFSVGSSGISARMGILERRDGERIAMWGVQGPSPAMRPNNQSAERVVERLNEELQHQRSVGPEPDAVASRNSGNWKKGSGSEYNQVKKYGDRGFQ